MGFITDLREQAKQAANITIGELALIWTTLWVVMILAIIAIYT